MIYLYPTPSSDQTLYADVDLHIEDMVQASDSPRIPEDFQDLLEAGALMREFKKREKLELYNIERARWFQRRAELRNFLNRETGAVVSERRIRRFSQLGPYYPPGS